MKRHRVVWLRDGTRIEVPPDWEPTPRPRAFYIGTDTTEPFRSMADGRHYTSKSRYRAEIKARGFEEAGNEIRQFLEPDLPKLPPIEQSLKEAADQLGI